MKTPLHFQEFAGYCRRGVSYHVAGTELNIVGSRRKGADDSIEELKNLPNICKKYKMSRADIDYFGKSNQCCGRAIELAQWRKHYITDR
jgi:hypothetical protein